MKKKALILISFAWLGFVILLAFYKLFGNSFIAALYNENSFPILNDILSGRNSHSLEFYTTKTEQQIFKSFVLAFLLSFLILGYVYLITPIKQFVVKSGLLEWSSRHLLIITFFSLVLFSILFRLPFFFLSVIGLNEGTFILMGQSLVDGNLPYTELWDLKPPLAYLPYAMSIGLFGKSIIGVRLIGAICLAISAYFTYRVGNHVWGNKVGALAALMCIIFVSIMASGQATSPEIIVTMPLMAALSLLVTQGINARTSFFVGFLLSVAVLIRLNLAYLVVVIGILLCAYPLFIQKRSPIQNALLYALGGCIPLAAVIAPYAITGHLEILFKSLVVLPLQYSGSQDSALESLHSFLIGAKFFGIQNALLWIGFIGGIAILIKSWARYSATQKSSILLIAIFFLGLILSLINNGVTRYDDMLQIIPVLSIPSSLFFFILFKRKFKPVLISAFIIILTITSQKVFFNYEKMITTLLSKKSLSHDSGHQLAAYLQKENPSKQPIYFTIYHVVQWLNGTKPLSKNYTHPDNLGRPFMLEVLVDSDATTATELKKLLQKKPLFIIKEKDDGFLKPYPEAISIFNYTLQNDYFFAKQFGKAYVFRRKIKNSEK